MVETITVSNVVTVHGSKMTPSKGLSRKDEINRPQDDSSDSDISRLAKYSLGACNKGNG